MVADGVAQLYYTKPCRRAVYGSYEKACAQRILRTVRGLRSVCFESAIMVVVRVVHAWPYGVSLVGHNVDHLLLPLSRVQSPSENH